MVIVKIALSEIVVIWSMLLGFCRIFYL